MSLALDSRLRGNDDLMQTSNHSSPLSGRSLQPFGHVEASGAGGIAFDLGGDLVTSLEIEARSLEFERAEQRAAAAAAPRFLFGGGDDLAAEPIAPQRLRQKEPVDIHQSQRGSPVEAAD